jgi:hypothetical protein
MMREFSVEPTKAQRELSHEEFKKDVVVETAASLLRTIDPNIEIEWVRSPAFDAGVRRVIVMEG